MAVCYHYISFVNLYLFCMEWLHHGMSSATFKHALNKSSMITFINLNTNFCTKSWVDKLRWAAADRGHLRLQILCVGCLPIDELGTLSRIGVRHWVMIENVALLAVWIELPKLLTAPLKTLSFCAADSTSWWLFFAAVYELRWAGGVHCSRDDVSMREDIDFFIAAIQRITCGRHRVGGSCSCKLLKLWLTSKNRKLRKSNLMPALVS